MKILNFTRFHKIGLLLAVMSITCAAAFGQPDKKFIQAQKENAAKLHEYTWKARTEVRKDNETKSVQLYLMRHDTDGTLQQTLLSGTQPEIPTKGLRGLIAKKKKEEFVKLLDDLGSLARAYSRLTPEKRQRFIVNTGFSSENKYSQELIPIYGRDVLQPGDSMTLWIDPVTKKQRKLEIQTTLENKSVRIIGEFADLPNGPTYLARSIIDYPSEELTITTENFDYVKKQ